MAGLYPHRVSSSALVTVSLPVEGFLGPGPRQYALWFFLEAGCLGHAWDSLRSSDPSLWSRTLSGTQ